MHKKKDTIIHNDIDKEFINKGKKALEDFDEKQELLVHPKKRESKLISLRLATGMLYRLRCEAQRREMGYQQLIKDYISEGLSRHENKKEIEQANAFSGNVFVVYAHPLTTGSEYAEFGNVPIVKEESLGGMYR